MHQSVSFIFVPGCKVIAQGLLLMPSDPKQLATADKDNDRYERGGAKLNKTNTSQNKTTKYNSRLDPEGKKGNGRSIQAPTSAWTESKACKWLMAG